VSDMIAYMHELANSEIKQINGNVQAGDEIHLCHHDDMRAANDHSCDCITGETGGGDNGLPVLEPRPGTK